MTTNIHREEMTWAGRPLVLETGRIARQADGAVLASYGETIVLATVVSRKDPKPGIDFLPLTVNYEEKGYAAGKIPGGFFKREGAPSEKGTLVCRLIDRPIRPLFAEGYRNETQVVATVMSFDQENDPDIVAMIAVSAALSISGLPFNGPIGAARVGFINGAFEINPTYEEMKSSKLDLVVAGKIDAVLMVESEARELSEETMLEAVMYGHERFKPVIETIARFAKNVGRPCREFAVPDTSELECSVAALAQAGLRSAYAVLEKQQRHLAIEAVKTNVLSSLCPTDAEPELSKELINATVKKLEAKIVRLGILDHGQRIDGRDLATIRPIVAEVGIVPRAHGSALFTRGETQAMVVATLGTASDEQFVEGLEGTRKESFLLHYNFPPYSVGETGRMGGPGRREIGHGKLAWRALHPVLPSAELFPYTIRVVSEITESNGSSSMATVCGASLAMMDAGVPLARPVAGIAMGLILEGERFAILSDILGDEDHLGDMDFKVAGTADGITSLQMDIKIAGITEQIMGRALEQAKQGRAHILNAMTNALESPRAEIGEHAPRIETMRVPVDKIRDVIGAGGKVIREIIQNSGAKIDIGDDGTVRIASPDARSISTAVHLINRIVAEPEVDEIYDGVVVKIVEFGAFVKFFGVKDGLVHISEMQAGRVSKVTDVVQEGSKVRVKYLGTDERGKIRLTMKSVEQQSTNSLPGEAGEQPTD